MKKLTTLFALALMAISASAASFDWKTSATGKIYEAGSTTLLASGTAYIFNSTATSQASVLAAFLAGEEWSADALNSKAVASGVIKATSGEAFAWGSAGETLNAFFAVVDGDKIYISTSQDQVAPNTGYSQFSFNAKATSQAGTREGTTFSGAGWYTAAVPEPTSAMLLVLGVAALALRRRRA